MNSTTRPLSVTVVACVYLAVGGVAFAAHFRDLLTLQQDAVWVELTELLAIVFGTFMLRGHDWARWLAIAWMAFHVILGALEARREFAVHGVIFVMIAWLLLRPDAARYFRPARREPA